MEPAAHRAQGVFVALAGVLAVSPDAMLLRWMRSLGASSPDVAVAKYIGIIAFMLALGTARGVSGAFVSPRHFLLSAVCQLGYQLSFTFCLLLTDAATALLLISLAPLWAALLGVVFLHEPLPRRTQLALVLSVCSVGLVFMPKVLRAEPTDEEEDASPPPPTGLSPGGSLAGAVLALVTGLAQGASLTVNRHAALHAPTAELTLATALSSLGATAVALYLPCYDSDDPHDFWACTPPVWRTYAFLGLALCDALSVASFYLAMLLAPRFLTGGEVAPPRLPPPARPLHQHQHRLRHTAHLQPPRARAPAPRAGGARAPARGGARPLLGLPALRRRAVGLGGGRRRAAAGHARVA